MSNPPWDRFASGGSLVSGVLLKTHVIANQRARWCGPFQGFPPVTIRSLRPPLAPPLGELAAKPTERVKFALSAPFRGHLSHRERQVALIRPLRRAPSPWGKAGGDGLPHQSADWFAMTIPISVHTKRKTDCDRRESLEGATPVCGLVRTDICYSVPF